MQGLKEDGEGARGWALEGRGGDRDRRGNNKQRGWSRKENRGPAGREKEEAAASLLASLSLLKATRDHTPHRTQ